ncbi:hypothetical protein ZWY2020_031092 [Hordeum vulgare]|nr:hypothetical protein ZWY2020_031092 [Hordeum vulgare]
MRCSRRSTSLPSLPPSAPSPRRLARFAQLSLGVAQPLRSRPPAALSVQPLLPVMPALRESSVWSRGRDDLFSRSWSSWDEDDEEALRWAALEKLPTYDRAWPCRRGRSRR